MTDWRDDIDRAVEGCECDACVEIRSASGDSGRQPQGSRSENTTPDPESTELSDFA